MRVTVLLFARYAELFGSERLALEVIDAACVGDVVDALRQLPGGVSLPAKPFVAINMTQADTSMSVTPDDVIALLPPLAGG